MVLYVMSRTSPVYPTILPLPFISVSIGVVADALSVDAVIVPCSFEFGACTYVVIDEPGRHVVEYRSQVRGMLELNLEDI